MSTRLLIIDSVPFSYCLPLPLTRLCPQPALPLCPSPITPHGSLITSAGCPQVSPAQRAPLSQPTRSRVRPITSLTEFRAEHYEESPCLSFIDLVIMCLPTHPPLALDTANTENWPILFTAAPLVSRRVTGTKSGLDKSLLIE